MIFDEQSELLDWYEADNKERYNEMVRLQNCNQGWSTRGIELEVKNKRLSDGVAILVEHKSILNKRIKELEFEKATAGTPNLIIEKELTLYRQISMKHEKTITTQAQRIKELEEYKPLWTQERKDLIRLNIERQETIKRLREALELIITQPYWTKEWMINTAKNALTPKGAKDE